MSEGDDRYSSRALKFGKQNEGTAQQWEWVVCVLNNTRLRWSTGCASVCDVCCPRSFSKHPSLTLCQSLSKATQRKLPTYSWAKLKGFVQLPLPQRGRRSVSGPFDIFSLGIIRVCFEYTFKISHSCLGSVAGG